MAKQPKTAVSASARVFAGVFPTGISYADRTVEVGGDYKRLAFLPFDTLSLEWRAKRIPKDVQDYIIKDAAKIQARRGEDYRVSSAGQTVLLGGSAETRSTPGAKSPAQLQAEIDAILGPAQRDLR